MTIRCIYHPVNGIPTQPLFPSTDQHPDAVRYLVGVYYVDAVGAEPTQAEIDIALDLDAGALDRKAATTIDGMDRLQFEHLFELENRVRTLEARPTITRAQYRQALIDRWKQLNP